MALRDVMDHAVRVQRENAEIRPLFRSRRMLAVMICALLLAFSAYSAIVRPEFIWGPAVVVAPEQADAGARMGMFLLAQRLEGVRAARGHYPESLNEVGEGASGVEYRVIGDSIFELRVKTDSASVLVFRSNENAARFLGDSPMRIQGRPR
jgi:hypothetical protein